MPLYKCINLNQGIDTTDATAASSDILNGQTAYVNGEKVTGTMPENSTTATEISTANQVVTVAKGYHTGGDTISISSTDRANIIASNIKKDVTILGVTGTVEEGIKINAQSKTVSPTFVTQEVIPDEDYNALSSVTVKSIPVSEEANDFGGETLIVGQEGTSVEDIFKVYIEKGTIEKFPSDLTSIRTYAFYRQLDIDIPTLPDGVTNIDAYAFALCSNIAWTSLPNALAEVGRNAFYGCSKLALTSLPSGFKRFNTSVFEDCTSLALTSLPDDTIAIGKNAFADCTGLKSLTIRSSQITILATSFSGCTNLKNIYVSWSEGAVANAPWGATNATITYNCT